MIPDNTRRDVNLRADGRCEQCFVRCRLQLHHLHYDTVGRETPNDLVALCDGCHRAKHYDCNGDFWRDPQEKQNCWESYWKELELG